MKELNYRPNAAARSLMTQQTNLIGLVVSNITNAFYPQIVDAICDRAHEAGRTVVLAITAENGHRQAALLDALAMQRVDGAILTSTFIGSEALIEPLIAQGLPIVLANRLNEQLAVDSVAIDNLDGGAKATRHLLDSGCSRIAFIGGRRDTATNRDKLAGYLEALKDAQAYSDPSLVRDGEYTYEHGYRSVQDLLALGREFDGILAADDTIALGCLDALADAHLSVPEKVKVVGFDNIPVAALRMVSLSTIDSQPARVGELALELLIDRIDNRYAGPPRRVVLPAELVARGSSARVGKNSSIPAALSAR